MTIPSRVPGLRRAAVGTTAMLCAGVLLAGCAGGGASDGSDGAATELSTTEIRTQINADPDSFLPFKARAGASEAVNGLLYSTLLYQDVDHGLVGGLAETWEVSPTQVSLTLRDGSLCSDGSPITASVVKQSLDAFAGPDGSTSAAAVFGPQTPTIEVDDATRAVTITLETPWADVAQGLSLVASGIVCPAGLADPEATIRGEVAGAFSGPYVLESLQPGNSVTLSLREDFAAWPEYPEPLNGQPAETVVFQVNGDISGVANALLTGTLDIAPVSGPAEQRFADVPTFSTEVIPKAAVYVLFNQREGMLFSDEKMRRAVAQSFDAQSFINAANGGIGSPATSFVPDSTACAVTDSSSLTKKDLEAARSALEGTSIRMVGTQALGAQGAGNTYLETALREVGAEVALSNLDNTSWATELGTHPDGWDLTIMPLLNPGRTIVGGLLPVVGTITEDGGRNYSGTPKNDVQKLLTEAMTAEDDEARCAKYDEVQDLVLERIDLIPITHAQQLNVVRDGFEMQVINGAAVPVTMRITK